MHQFLIGAYMYSNYPLFQNKHNFLGKKTVFLDGTPEGRDEPSNSPLLPSSPIVVQNLNSRFS